GLAVSLPEPVLPADRQGMPTYAPGRVARVPCSRAWAVVPPGTPPGKRRRRPIALLRSAGPLVARSHPLRHPDGRGVRPARRIDPTANSVAPGLLGPDR